MKGVGDTRRRDRRSLVNPLLSAPPRLQALWALAEKHGAVLVDTFNDPDTVEREYKFPTRAQQDAYVAEVKCLGLI